MMNEVRIIKLNVHRFQGLEDVVIEPRGRNIEVCGSNGSGKTTIGNAIMWLLFDKSLDNVKDFGIKNTKLETNEGVVYSVECEFNVNDISTTLKRNFYEKWVTDRNTKVKTFKGHTNEYFIDGMIQEKSSAYLAVVASWVKDDETFKLISNPMYFASLHWKKRREIVLSICDDVDDKMVFESSAELKKFQAKLDGSTIDGYKAQQIFQREDIKKKDKNIPGAIEEVNRRLIETTIDENTDWDKLETVRTNIKLKITEEKNKRTNASSSMQNEQDYTRKVSRITELINGRTKVLEDEKGTMRTKLLSDYNNKVSDIGRKQGEIDYQKTLITREEEEKAVLDQKTILLRQEYGTVNEKVQDDISVDLTCYACGSDLSEDVVEESKKKVTDKFTKDKETELAEIVVKGNKAKKDSESCDIAITLITEKINLLDSELENLIKERIDIEVEGKNLKESVISLVSDETYKGYQNQLIELTDNPVTAHKFDESVLTTFETQLEKINETLLNKDNIDKDKKRLQTLRNEESENGKKLLAIANELTLCDKFYQSKVKYIEASVAKKFKIARFKMFNQLVNGEFEDTCEILYDEVPYNKGLNKGAQAKVGIDIINVLSEKYQVKVPVIIDNAESIDIIEANTQVISLVKPPLNTFEELVAKGDKVIPTLPNKKLIIFGGGQ